MGFEVCLPGGNRVLRIVPFRKPIGERSERNTYRGGGELAVTGIL